MGSSETEMVQGVSEVFFCHEAPIEHFQQTARRSEKIRISSDGSAGLLWLFLLGIQE